MILSKPLCTGTRWWAGNAAAEEQEQYQTIPQLEKADCQNKERGENQARSGFRLKLRDCVMNRSHAEGTGGNEEINYPLVGCLFFRELYLDFNESDSNIVLIFL